ncbi:hypothetical protein Leryth_025214 [Lithospermum erythrorhizon]|nr:hypothetical protein Leryth_025214 [Lithospermum erythrorhizon]
MYALKTPMSISNISVSNFSTPSNVSASLMFPSVTRGSQTPISGQEICSSPKWWVYRNPIDLRNCCGLACGSYSGCSYSHLLDNQVQIFELSLKSKSRLCNTVKKAGRNTTNCVMCSGSEEVHDDGYYMRRCVELARTAVGFTSPNPMVGCIIVKDDKIVGQGFHPKAGQPHAEVFALRDAGDMAENATAYVTLEPCNHYGRTPPCTEALIKAKVKKVVVGMVDPNPIVASKGVQRLRDAGIDVTVCVEEELCKKMLEAYTHKMLTGNPFVTLRYSVSVNGQVLDHLGEKVMDSGGYYSKLLQEYDSVIYSSALLSHKFFLPESKEPGANQPLQVVLAKSPPSLQICDFTGSKMAIFTENETTGVPDISQNGIEVVVSGHQRLTSILEYCSRQGHCSLLLDLRGNSADFKEILQEGFENNLFKKVVAEVQPLWVEKQEEPWNLLGKPLQLKNLTSRVLGGSVLLEGYFC